MNSEGLTDCLKPMKGKENVEPGNIIPNGSLILIGGSDDFGQVTGDQAKEIDEVFWQILKSFLSLIEAEVPVIEIITASGCKDPVGTYWKFSKALEKIDSCQVNHVHQRYNEKFCIKEIRHRIEIADAVFFADGDRSTIISTYADSEIIDLIRYRYNHEKLVVAGSNSGAMALSSKIFPDISEGDANIEPDITDGLSLLSNLSVDTAYASHRRLHRMVWLMAIDPDATVLSISKNTAVIVKPGMELTPIGSGTMMMSHGNNKRNNEKLLFTKGLDLKMLMDGARYKLLSASK